MNTRWRSSLRAPERYESFTKSLRQAGLPAGMSSVNGRRCE